MLMNKIVLFSSLLLSFGTLTLAQEGDLFVKNEPQVTIAAERAAPTGNIPSGAAALRAPEPDLDICSVSAPPGPIRGRPATQSLTFRPIRRGWRGSVNCILGGPADIMKFRVECEKATYLDFSIADCCVPNDHFQLKGKNWDRAPQTAVTTSPGPANQYGVPARVYNYDGTPENPGNIDAYIQCSYLHGVDLFGAGAYIRFSSDASSCTITNDGTDTNIDRSP